MHVVLFTRTLDIGQYGCRTVIPCMIHIMYVLCTGNTCVTKENFPLTMLRWTICILLFLKAVLSLPVQKGDRVAQLIIERIFLPELLELDVS